MKRFRFIEKGLCCDVYYSKEMDINACALFLYGFPATIGENSLTNLLVEKGYTVLHPHYYGTYDSDGDFTPQAAFMTVKNINEIVKTMVRDLKRNVMVRIPDKITVCVGYSFGAYVLKHSIEQLNDLKTIMLFSPVMSTNACNDSCWYIENGLEHLNYVIRTRPFTYRIKKMTQWMEYYVNDHDLVNTKTKEAIEHVLWVYGNLDEDMIANKLKSTYIQATKKYLSKSAIAEIVCVENGNHSINSLINENTIRKIEEIL